MKEVKRNTIVFIMRILEKQDKQRALKNMMRFHDLRIKWGEPDLPPLPASPKR